MQGAGDHGQGEAILHGLLEAVPDAVVVVDGGGHITLANGQAEELFGYRPGELAGESIELLVPERLRALHAKHRGGYAADPVTRPMGAIHALEARRRDGTEFYADISLGVTGTGAGTLVLAVVRDVSDRERFARELQRRIHDRTAEIELARAELARIAHSAAHELVEPIRMVRINAQLLAQRHGQELDGDAAQCLRYLVEGSARAYDLVADLLTVAEAATAPR